MSKGKYMAKLNAIKRWQSESKVYGNVDGGNVNESEKRETVYCIGCRTKTPHKTVREVRNGDFLIKGCVRCGHTIRKPNPDRKNMVLGAIFLEQLQDDGGISGMGQPTYEAMTSMLGQPILDEKNLKVSPRPFRGRKY